MRLVLIFLIQVLTPKTKKLLLLDEKSLLNKFSAMFPD